MPAIPHPLPTDIAEALRRGADRIGSFGRDVRWFAEVSSTNDIAASIAEAGAAEGTVVMAETQSAGRGRRGRQWASPAGAGLYTSVILRPRGDALSAITIVAGVAVAEGILAATGLDVTVKWPNDIYVGPRKLAGILAEAGTTPTDAPHVVLGFGINLMPAAYPPEIASRATSLEVELGRPVDRGLLLAECLASLSRRYGELQHGAIATVLDAWRLRARATMGRQVEWETGGEVRRGVAEAVDDTGALLIRTSNGMERVISGEVRWM